jgi:putative transposase
MSCTIIGLNRCAYYYQPKLPDDSVIMSVLSALTDRHLRWNFPKYFNRTESSAITEIINVFIEYTAS